MIDKAYHIRDKALISVLYESRCRISDLLTRRIKHIVFDEYGAILMIDRKTGMRRIRLIQSVPLLANWIENHPQRDNPNSFLCLLEILETIRIFLKFLSLKNSSALFMLYIFEPQFSFSSSP